MRSVTVLFLKRLLRWLVATGRWIWEVNRFWAPFLVALVICASVAVIWRCPVEREVRLTGMVLQLLGLITIVLRLRAAQQQFPEQMLKHWWQRRPRFKAQNTVIIAALMANDSADTASFRARVTPGPQATLEQRLAMLEDSYTKLFDEVGGFGYEVKRRTDELSGKLQDELTAREAADKRIDEQLREEAVGSLHLDLWGVLFFILGIIAGTASPEIAAWIGAGLCRST